MTVSEIAALILTQNEKFKSVVIAKAAVRTTFKTEFPYWDVNDWDIEIPDTKRKTLLEKYTPENAPSIRQLILDLSQV